MDPERPTLPETRPLAVSESGETGLIAQSSRVARSAAQIGGLSIALTLLGPLLSYFRVLTPYIGFAAFVVGLLLIPVAAALGWMAVSRAMAAGQQLGRMQLVLSGVGGCVIVLFVSSLVATRGFRVSPGGCTDAATCAAVAIDNLYASAYRPREYVIDQLREFSLINDISTDLVNPPDFSSALVMGGDWTFPKASLERQAHAYPNVETIYAGGQPPETFPIVLGIAEEQGWTIQVQQPELLVFEATAETPVFHFVDDITVRMASSLQCPIPTNGRCSSTAVDTRSKSRHGLSDFGRNADRIRAFNTRIRELTVESALEERLKARSRQP